VTVDGLTLRKTFQAVPGGHGGRGAVIYSDNSQVNGTAEVTDSKVLLGYQMTPIFANNEVLYDRQAQDEA
jgi:hypothetical protein